MMIIIIVISIMIKMTMLKVTTTMMMMRRSAEVGETEAEEGVESMLLGRGTSKSPPRRGGGRLSLLEVATS